MPHHHDGFVPRVFFQELPEIGQPRLWPHSGIEQQFALISKFIADERRGLRAALQWTGDDGVNLDVESGQGASHVAALFDSFFVESAFFIFLWVGNVFTGAGMAQEV